MKKTLSLVGLVLAIIVSTTGPAFAHVTVSPESAEKGGYTKVTFRVPNEKDDATTTKVEVALPTDTPLASVSVQPHAGWTYVVDKTKLATPIKSDDGDVTDAVSKVTWTAQASAAIKAGEFDEFSLAVGPLPSTVDSITFKVLQTYSNGDVARWIDTATAGGTEPAHPAPTLTLTAGSGATTTVVPSSASTKDSTSDDSGRGVAVTAIVLAVVGLLLSFASLTVRRRPNTPS